MVSEIAANRVRESVAMPLKLARALICAYGVDAVIAMLDTPFVRDADKPAGALRHLLARQGASSDDAPALTGVGSLAASKQRISSDLSEFVDRS